MLAPTLGVIGWLAARSCQKQASLQMPRKIHKVLEIMPKCNVFTAPLRLEFPPSLRHENIRCLEPRGPSLATLPYPLWPHCPTWLAWELCSCASLSPGSRKSPEQGL